MSLSCSSDDLVIDISNVHDIEHIIVEIIRNHSTKNIKRYVRPVHSREKHNIMLELT